MKSLQKEQNSTNLLLWPPICRDKPAITPKWFNSLDTNSSLWVWIPPSEKISTNSKSLFRLVQNKISTTLSGKTCSNYEWAIIFDQNGKRLVSVVMSKYYLTSQPNIIRVSCMNYGNCQRLEKDWNRHSRHKPSK